jgi:hypothetical protein
MAFGAKINAEVAFLAQFFLDLDVSFHSMSPKQFLPVIQSLLAVAILRIMFRMSSIFRF